MTRKEFIRSIGTTLIFTYLNIVVLIINTRKYVPKLNPLTGKLIIMLLVTVSFMEVIYRRDKCSKEMITFVCSVVNGLVSFALFAIIIMVSAALNDPVMMIALLTQPLLTILLLKNIKITKGR